MRTYLVRIPHRKGHSIHRDVLAGFLHRWRKPPPPRTDSSWPPREGSRVAARQLRSNNRAEAGLLSFPPCSVRFDSPFGAPTIPPTWAEGRALLRSNPSAVPGPTPNGAARGRPLPFGIGTQAPNRLTRAPPRSRVYTSYTL